MLKPSKHTPMEPQHEPYFQTRPSQHGHCACATPAEPDGSATMGSHGYAWNQMERGALAENGGNALWEVWGTYEHSFIQTEAGWRVDGMSFFATAERGNDFVRNTPGS